MNCTKSSGVNMLITFAEQKHSVVTCDSLERIGQMGPLPQQNFDNAV